MSWSEIFGRYGLNWLLKDVWYRLDWRKPNPSRVKHFLIENVEQAFYLYKHSKLPMFSGTRDQKMLQIFKWVKDNIVYEIDSKRFKVTEKWQTIDETITFKRGDCEDGAILLFALARLNKISSAQVKVCTGTVKLSNGSTAGHCWLEYMPDEFFGEWYTLDWCYYPNDLEFKNRDSVDVTKYLTRWFEVTDFEV